MARQKRYTVLVIFSERIAAEVLAARLEPEGFVILRALSANEALEIARRRLPDAVVVDHHLSAESGLAVLRLFQTREETRPLPVVLIASQEAAMRRRVLEEAIRLGASDVLLKPLEPALLREKLLMLIRLREMARERFRSIQLLTEGFHDSIQSAQGLAGLVLSNHFGNNRNPQETQALLAIESACRDLRRQLSRLLNSLRTRSMTYEYEYTRNDLATIVRNAAERVKWHEGHVGFAFDPEPGLAPILCDEGELTACFAQLLEMLCDLLPGQGVALQVTTNQGTIPGCLALIIEFPTAPLPKAEYMTLLRALMHAETPGKLPPDSRLSFLRIVSEGHGGIMSVSHLPGENARLVIHLPMVPPMAAET